MRCILAALAPVALVVGIAPAAPVPPEARKPMLYYPTRVGDELVYDRGGVEVTHVVTSVAEKDGVKVVSIGERSGGSVSPFEKMEVSAKGLTRLEISGQQITPLVMLRVPHPKGDKWEFTTSGAWGSGVEVKGTKVVTGPESLKLGDRTYESIAVESEYTLNGGKLKATFWYSPNVGLVKQTSSQNQSLTLKAFTPAP